MDAATKPNHFRKCAAVTKGIPPNLMCNFAEAEAEVRALEREGKLSLKDYVDSDCADNDNIRECDNHLHCARHEAPAAGAGPCDVHGVVGGVCSHGIPLKGMFIDMHGPEQFIYYLVMLKTLLKHCPTIKAVYVDFACRLKVTWQRFVAKQKDRFFTTEAEASAAKDLRLIVNWMHGSSHNLSCQLQNNGRYTIGAGRRHGEGSEQLWSMLKAAATLMRYMKHSHRREWLEASLQSPGAYLAGCTRDPSQAQ